MLKTIENLPFKEVIFKKNGEIKSVPFSQENFEILLKRIGAVVSMDDRDGLLYIDFPYMSVEMKEGLGYVGDGNIEAKVTDIIDYAIVHKMPYRDIPRALKAFAKKKLLLELTAGMGGYGTL